MKRLLFISIPVDCFKMDAARLVEFLKIPRSFQKTDIPVFISKRYHLQTLNIEGRRCHIIEPKNEPRKARPVLLFLHGGAFIMETSLAHWRTLGVIMQKTGAQIWAVEYPQLPQANIIKSVEAVVAVYKHLLKIYTAGEITVFCDSAGAALALTLCHWLKAYDAQTPMPEKMVLVSPGQLKTENPNIRAEMEAIEKEDIIQVKLLDAITEIMALSSDSDDFYLKVFEGDFFGFPPLHIFSGTRETFYPQVKDFVSRLEKSGASVLFYEGEGMCHDWAFIPFAKESKAALEKIVEIIKSRDK
jgi:acetyl esterase/lipase